MGAVAHAVDALRLLTALIGHELPLCITAPLSFKRTLGLVG